MTGWPDLVNGAFELAGGFVVLLSVRRLWHDRVVKGVDPRVNVFFTAWGAWNLFYYPHLDQWLSFYGGVAVTASNAAWLALFAWLALAHKGVRR